MSFREEKNRTKQRPQSSWRVCFSPVLFLPHSSSLPGKSHGWRSLVGCSPWGRKESDTTEWLHFHFSLSWIGEGNGNPLQCSCLENPRDRGAWWVAVYGVAQSWTWLKRLSSSNSNHPFTLCQEHWPLSSGRHFDYSLHTKSWLDSHLVTGTYSDHAT